MLTQEEKQVLIDLKAVIDNLEYRMLLVGSNARRLIFDFPFKIAGRGTTDWDITVPLKNWDDYETLTKYLTQEKNSCFKKTVTQHRFIHIQTNIMVDIIPCGEIGEPDQEIQWQDGHLMNIMGFTEALENASVEIIKDCNFHVVDIISFIILKFFAWNDRGINRNQESKDWQDINFIFSNYNNPNNNSIDDRIFTELETELGNESISYQDAAIYLIGKDIKERLQTKTLINLKEILNKSINILSDYDDNDRQSFMQRLNILRRGIDE